MFNPTLEYDSLPDATYSYLGYHSSVCNDYGCTDPFATNYDPTAIVDNGSCLYANVCDSSLTIPGWYPDSITNLANAYVGQSYNQVIQIVVPLDTFLLGALLPIDNF